MITSLQVYVGGHKVDGVFHLAAGDDVLNFMHEIQMSEMAW